MKRFILLFLGAMCSLLMQAQTPVSIKKEFRLYYSGDINKDKNFYFITALSKNRQALSALRESNALKEFLESKKNLVKSRSADTSVKAVALLAGFKWQNDTTALMNALSDVYEKHTSVFDELLNKEVRPSGCYQRFIHLLNKDLLLACWRETFKGINTIINHYGLNTGFRYAGIDSSSYDVTGDYYTSYLKDYFAYLDERTGSMQNFYEPSLTIALELMRANERNEAADFEPLEMGENQKASVQVKLTNFAKNAYSAILVPGQGPDIASASLDPVGKLRCELAATRWRSKLAPFIIVSGGKVHPFHTPYAEALEMKKYLMQHEAIPESAIIIEPQARHTTTNFRNAARLMIRYGMPVSKPALCVSTKEQTDYIADERFDKRNLRELGYVPYTGKKHLSNHEVVFYPVLDCLQIDPIDPLDP